MCVCIAESKGELWAFHSVDKLYQYVKEGQIKHDGLEWSMIVNDSEFPKRLGFMVDTALFNSY